VLASNINALFECYLFFKFPLIYVFIRLATLH